MNYGEMFDSILRKDAVKSLIKMEYWDGKFINPVNSYKSISICTTCMNRLNDLSQTLPKNIEDNKNYQGTLEFVLLDYNSQDGLGEWIKKNLMQYIESGLLVYYRTDEPKSYSMSHSRNVAMKLATGHILNSVDADNFIGKGFVDKINILSHQQPEKAIFLKGRRMLRGRLGYYKDEFIQLLGAYDEVLGQNGYGAEDGDLVYRACGLGFKLMWFGGDFYKGLPNSPKHQTPNFRNQNWRYTEKVNKLISFFNIFYQLYKANVGIEWGKATVTKNFGSELIKV
jgi:hypothetical protein